MLAARIYKHIANTIKIGLLINICLLFSNCSQKVELKGFNQAAWQKDIKSCQNIRPTLLPSLKKAIPQLMGLNHYTIIDLLGKPEGNSLEKSSERIYYYYVASGSQCTDKNSTANSDKILIRFDALDRVYKVWIQND